MLSITSLHLGRAGGSAAVAPHRNRHGPYYRPCPANDRTHTVIEAGQPAPTFTLPDQEGRPVSLEDLRGRPVVIYFYPKDDTPGCTTQACGIRDQWAEFEDAGAAVLGISPDTVESHARFAGKYDLAAHPPRRSGTRGARGVRRLRREGPLRQDDRRRDPLGRSSSMRTAPSPRCGKRVQAKKHADQVLKALDELT
jgi:thioredoxin-dependent peroxiredoxin